MLVEEQMELVEGMPGNLPVVLLVEIAKGDRIGEDLVQVLRARRARLLVQGNRQLRDFAVRLNFPSLLVQDRFRSLCTALKLIVSGTALIGLGSHLFVTSAVI